MRRLALLALPVVLISLAVPSRAADLAFTVNALTDLPDLNPGDGLCAAQDGHCTLRAALDEGAKNGSGVTISLPSGIIPLTTPLVMATTVSITGQGDGTVLDATATTSVATVSLSSLTLSSLALRGGTSEVGGGSALNATESALVLKGVTISGAHSGYGGGALQVVGGSVSLDSVTVRDSDGTDGAALHAVSSDVTVTGCTFERNTATANGGAVFLSYPTALAVSGSTFRDNAAAGKGGAIYLEGRARGAKGLALSGTFKDNSARGPGGAVFVRTTSDGISDGTLTFDRPTFNGNAGGVGGAVGIDDGRVSISGGTFTANKARSGGGGAVAAAGDLTVTDTTFTSNAAAEAGGAISSLGLARISGSTFTSNVSGTSGGALALQGFAVPTVASNPFDGNVAAHQAQAIWRGGAGLTQSKNTYATGQDVVVDAPAHKAEKVSLAKAATHGTHAVLIEAVAAAVILALGLGLGWQLRRRRTAS